MVAAEEEDKLVVVEEVLVHIIERMMFQYHTQHPSQLLLVQAVMVLELPEVQ